jgi:ABC-type glutathione transport system ATPase component
MDARTLLQPATVGIVGESGSGKTTLGRAAGRGLGHLRRPRYHRA